MENDGACIHIDCGSFCSQINRESGTIFKKASRISTDTCGRKMYAGIVLQTDVFTYGRLYTYTMFDRSERTMTTTHKSIISIENAITQETILFQAYSSYKGTTLSISFLSIEKEKNMNSKNSSTMRILGEDELDQVVGGACSTTTPTAPKKPAAPVHHAHHHIVPAPAPVKPLAPPAPTKPATAPLAATKKMCG
jgi:hypothetical protein